MSLTLENVTRMVDGQYYINQANLSFEPGSFNVLLGRTLSGKTSLMRLMAGLDKPNTGRVLMNGLDVTGVSVQERNVSMVYQQFINYPNMSVYDNIASPLRLANESETTIKKRVMETAEMLRITPFLSRLPLELSGGQQQRTAMARALIKDADIILFDEPLVNLDYKLREELRQEMRELFAQRNTIAVYATTEPNEALALGGTTTILHEGRVIQSGPTADTYHSPCNVTAAALFNEPPINLIAGKMSATEVTFDDKVHFPLNADLKALGEGNYQFGIRPSHLSLLPKNDDDLEISVQVELAEISGSETFLHVRNEHFQLVLHLSGVHSYHVDEKIKIYVPTHKLHVFDHAGELIQASSRRIEDHYHG
ncbi:ABC transporter ATP-binding protein [Agarivorans sp. JK6]|uniref:ABC transporter ATP-binding protein n=1 Tax=Agarivorans sp. JK6 TaxID=2997426 RepID=UPI0038736162